MVDIYIRVSSQEQAESGYSVGEQELKLREYAKMHDMAINQVCVDAGYSGGTMDRPALQNLLEDAKSKKIDKVLIYKLDRLSRRTRDVLMIIEDILVPNSVSVISLTESLDTSTPSGLMFISMMSSVSQLERSNIRERSMMGRYASARMGHYIGSVAPYGFDRVKVDNYYTLVPNADIENVKLIFEMASKGISYRNIARHLNTFSKTMTGTNWEQTQMAKIIHNDVYKGYLSYGKGTNRKISIKCLEPIVDEELFDSLQNRTHHHARINNLVNPLAGIFVCSTCGTPMQMRTIRKPTKQGIKAYKGFYCNRVSCTASIKSVPYAPVINAIIDTIKSEVEDIEATSKPKSSPKKLTSLKRKADELAKKEEKLFNLLEDGVYSTEVFKNRHSKLLEERNELSKLITLEEEKLADSSNKKEIKVRLHSVIEELKKDEFDVESMNMILRTIINKIEFVDGENINVYML